MPSMTSILKGVAITLAALILHDQLKKSGIL